mmetsp:Transcript_12203/g.22520  ORF Transcript_12203/g.22520 Transcript_12203/m.22520 type:complete len:690 (+) Transcript_12203:26-2095(+)
MVATAAGVASGAGPATAFDPLGKKALSAAAPRRRLQRQGATTPRASKDVKAAGGVALAVQHNGPVPPRGTSARATLTSDGRTAYPTTEEFRPSSVVADRGVRQEFAVPNVATMLAALGQAKDAKHWPAISLEPRDVRPSAPPQTENQMSWATTPPRQRPTTPGGKTSMAAPPSVLADGAGHDVPMRPSTPCGGRSEDGRRGRRASSASGRRVARGTKPHPNATPPTSSGLCNFDIEYLPSGEGPDVVTVHDLAGFGTGRGESRSGRESVLGAAPSVPGEAAANIMDSPPPRGTSARRPEAEANLTRARPTSSCSRSRRAGRAPRPASSCGMAPRPAPDMPRAARDEETAEETEKEGGGWPVMCAPPLDRPPAPTPEHTNHWLHGMDQAVALATTVHAHHPVRSAAPSGTGGRDELAESGSSASPRECRPRSPTPTKMLAWEEDSTTAIISSPCDSDLDRGNHMDALITKLISACQMNDVSKAFAIYDKLRGLSVPLYEGVYALLIECCMQTQQLGYAMQCYETLRCSGQRVSARLVSLLMEACAREQHPDKVLSIWKTWCPPPERVTASHSEVLLLTVSALVRTLSPELACEVLTDASYRCPETLPYCLVDHSVELEELISLNEAVADESRANGNILGEDMVAGFQNLRGLLEELTSAASDLASRLPKSRAADAMFMEDVDLDLELAAF